MIHETLTVDEATSIIRKAKDDLGKVLWYMKQVNPAAENWNIFCMWVSDLENTVNWLNDNYTWEGRKEKHNDT